MTHLPFIAAAYGLTAAVTLWLSLGATLRLRRARRRLAAVDPRGRMLQDEPRGRARDGERAR